MTLSVRRHSASGSAIDVEFAPALPLGAIVTSNGVVATRTPGDVHANVHATVADSAEMAVAFTGGWSIAPPESHPAVGARSSAPRILSERLATSAAPSYDVELEGLGGRAYTFVIGAPTPEDARRLVARVSKGAVQFPETLPRDGTMRRVTIIFPGTGQNADGYSTTRVSFTTGVP